MEVNLDGEDLDRKGWRKRRTLKAGRKLLPDEIERLIEKGLMETMKRRR